MDKLDWNQLRAFLETAETGSLSAAARKLGVTADDCMAANPDIVILIELGQQPLGQLDDLLEGYPYRAGSMRLATCAATRRS